VTEPQTSDNEKVRGKALSVEAWTGPEGSRRMRVSDFKKIVDEGGKVYSPKHRPPLPPGNIPGPHFCQSLSRPQGHGAAEGLCQ
jgi:hypothetical protein